MQRLRTPMALRFLQFRNPGHWESLQLYSLATNARHLCIRATNGLCASSSGSDNVCSSSSTPLNAKEDSVGSKKSLSMSQTPREVPQAIFSKEETSKSAEMELPHTVATPLKGGAQLSMSDAFAQPPSVHSSSPPPPSAPPPQDSLPRRLLASWQQGVVASIGAVMGIGFLVYFLYIPVKEDTVHHTAVVASEALADSRLKEQAVQLTKDVLLEVLRNPKSLDATVDVVVELLAREETKIAISSLLQSLFEDHYTQEVTKKFVLRVVQDPWIQDQLQMITEEQVRKLLNNNAIKTELSKFLLKSALESLEKPQLHYEVAKAVRHSVASIANFWWN